MGKTMEKRIMSWVMMPGLVSLKASKIAVTEDSFPSREPKSCENPPIPILSSLMGVRK